MRSLSLWCSLSALALLCAGSPLQAMEFVSVSESHAILYDSPALNGKKLFVVNRYMPFESVVTVKDWVKVRDRNGALSWIEARAVTTASRYLIATAPLVDVYAAPDSSSARLFQVRQAVALELLQSTGTGWLKVRHLSGDIGYVRHSDVWGD